MKRTLISKTGQKIRLMSIKGKTFVTLGKKTMPLHLSLDEAEAFFYSIGLLR
ncbi:hypothetical protein [uncultured Fusobacterium sp.]|uniref:hypothetical protein n=1 Tax=uncultured Fusobacterium sp. TaxID=159267 RepID=UPI0025CB88DB|nr:hypothetical protein [uncultured Fusobacterium sp.]